MAAGRQHEMPLRSERNPDVQIAQFTEERPLPGFIIAHVLQIAMPVRPSAPVLRIEEHLGAVKVEIVAQHRGEKIP